MSIATLAPEAVRSLIGEIGWVSPSCRAVNEHHHCNFHGGCACTCHKLDNAEIGWLVPILQPLIAESFPEYERNDDGWYCAATVLAPFWCGTDPVRIQHAIGRGAITISVAARRLREAGIWRENEWTAHYADEATSDGAAAVELACHVLVSQGLVRAKWKGKDLLFQHFEGVTTDIGTRTGKALGRSPA